MQISVIEIADTPMLLYKYQIAGKESKSRQRGYKKMLEVLFGPVGPTQWPATASSLLPYLPTYSYVRSEPVWLARTSQMQWMIRRSLNQWALCADVAPRTHFNFRFCVVREYTSMGSPICIP